MLPGFPSNDATDGSLSHIEAVGERPLGHITPRIQGSNHQHVVLAKPGSPVPLTSACLADSLASVCIRFMSAPFKILGAVIGANVVLVTDDCANEGGRPDEGKSHHLMNEGRASQSVRIQRYMKVAPSRHWFENYRSVFRVATRRIGFYTAEVRNGVGRTERLIGDRLPCLLVHVFILPRNMSAMTAEA